MCLCDRHESDKDNDFYKFAHRNHIYSMLGLNVAHTYSKQVTYSNAIAKKPIKVHCIDI